MTNFAGQWLGLRELAKVETAAKNFDSYLKFDATTEQVVGDDEANTLLRGTYRAPYVVSEQI